MGFNRNYLTALFAAVTFAGCSSSNQPPCEFNDTRPECQPKDCTDGDPRPLCKPQACVPNDPRPQCQPVACEEGDTRPECIPDDCVENDPRPECPNIIPGNGALGDLCNVPGDCQSSLCVAIGSGADERICSRRCETDANCEEETWECIAVDAGSGDDVRTCIPRGNCLDRDGDLYGIGAGCLGRDCDDTDPNTHPGANEICDGKDNNCDTVIDDYPVDAGVPCAVAGGVGRCATGEMVCTDGALHCEGIIQPGQIPETCNGIDDDCDGETDTNISGLGQACSPPGSACANGQLACDPNRGLYCEGSTSTATDALCDGLDENCNGRVDEDVPNLGNVCSAGQGACMALGQFVCATNPTAPVVCSAVPNSGAASPEVCNYQDDNCDGTVDEGFANIVGGNRVYNTTQACGGCGVNCNNLWDASIQVGMTPTCGVVGTVATCKYTCKNNYVDADGISDNGCELLPDPDAIYVKTPNKGGSDSASCGAWNAPCATIGYGIGRAAAASKVRVLVAEGIYREGIALRPGISVLGGHSSLNFLRRPNEHTTVIYGSAAPTTWGGATGATDSIAVVAKDITTATELSGFTIIAPDGGASGNSIGIFVRNSTSALTIKDNTIQAGVGGQGSSGLAGTNGLNGGNGNAGAKGTTSNDNTCNTTVNGGGGGASTCNVPSGGVISVAGGAGANGTCPVYATAGHNPSAGSGGGPNASGGGAAGFTAWARGLVSNDGKQCLPHSDLIDKSFSRDGGVGAIGANGSAGSGASSSVGSVDGFGLWRPSNGGDAGHGTAGGGGGGGGASHGIETCSGTNSTGTGFTGCKNRRYIGSSGGGGGGGGCAGAAAQGGGGGGASFAVLITYSTFTTLPTLTGNALVRNNGGQGGDGGIGGRGGDGGLGASGGPEENSGNDGSYCMQTGRRGGDGGNGGHGGGGGGGAGGSSYGILIRGTTQSGTLGTANTFTVPAGTNLAGAGGPGGGSLGNSGTAGVAGQFGNINAAN